MPLWKYFAGDFLSPVERVFHATQRLGNPKPAAANEEARATVKRVQEMLREFCTGDSTWKDEGDEVFCEQYGYNEFHLLRAYAAEFEALSGKRPDFDETADPAENPHLKKIGTGVSSDYRHLIKHSDNEGFWLPIALDRPVLIDPDTYLVAGSSSYLLAELDSLAPALGMTRDWLQLASGEYAAPKDDPLGRTKFSWSVLHAAARLSVEHGLPIIFDG
ncbi:MAG: hypothetical protein AAB074_13480 [Planctomycetota bacterium]